MEKSKVEWFPKQIIKIINGNHKLPETQILEQSKQMEKEINDIKYLIGNIIYMFAGIAIGFLLFG